MTSIIEQITKQLNKLIDVVKLLDITGDAHVEREIMLVKVRVAGGAREEVKRIADIFRGRILDVTQATYIIEVTPATAPSSTPSSERWTASRYSKWCVRGPLQSDAARRGSGSNPHFYPGHSLRTEVLTLTVSLLLRYIPESGSRDSQWSMAWQRRTMLRLSKYFLLLDFLYDQSMMDGVVRDGDCTRKKIASIDEDSEVFSEGQFLCESILDRVVEQHGPVSIAAGLWFKELPGQKDAHDSTSSVVCIGGDRIPVQRWTLLPIRGVNRNVSPTTFLKNWVIDNKWHRARSYDGSEFCCLASLVRGNDPTKPSYKCREGNWRRRPYTIQSPGRASRTDLGYENQMRKAESFWCDNSSSESGGNPAKSVIYGRKSMPLLDHSIVEVPEDALESPADVEQKVVRPWHVRVSDFFVLLDFCRNEMMFDRKNLSRTNPLVAVPPLTFRTANSVIKTARMFGEVLDPIKERLGNISVVRGMEAERVLRWTGRLRVQMESPRRGGAIRSNSSLRNARTWSIVIYARCC